jgi:hypothetical protein
VDEFFDFRKQRTRFFRVYPQRRAQRDRYRVLQLFSSGFGFSRHYPVGSHPTAFANGHTIAIETHRTGARFIFKSSYHNRGTFYLAGSGG